MARYDLDELRLTISALADEAGAPLSESEFNSLTYYGEDRLREKVADYEAIVETEVEETESLSPDEDYTRPHLRLSVDDYDDEFWDDVPDEYWEVEITCDYSEQ